MLTPSETSSLHLHLQSSNSILGHGNHPTLPGLQLRVLTSLPVFSLKSILQTSASDLKKKKKKNTNGFQCSSYEGQTFDRGLKAMNDLAPSPSLTH